MGMGKQSSQRCSGYIGFQKFFWGVIFLGLVVGCCVYLQLGISNESGISIVKGYFQSARSRSQTKSIPLSEDWQQIVEVQDDIFFIYSAYLDYYNKQLIVRVIAVTPSKSKKQLFCHLYHEDMIPLGIVPATIKSTKAPVTYRRYSPGFIFCDLKALKKSILRECSMGPIFVAVLPSSTIGNSSWPDPNSTKKVMLSTEFQASNLLKVSRNSYPPEYAATEQHEFGLCVQPTFDYDNAFDFVQWMEYHLMMGVSHFTFYNMSIGPTVSKVMESYGPEMITVLPWSIPMKHNDSVLHINGQIAQANDCVFRYRGLAKYVVMVDLDEYIVPNSTSAKNFTQMLEVIAETGPSMSEGEAVAQFQFRSAFFAFEYPAFGQTRETKDQVGISVEDLRLYRHVVRMEMLPFTERSKIITTPKLVVEPGIHSLDESVDEALQLGVPSTIAYSHHYREFGCGNNCSSFKTEVDLKGHFYAVKLLKRVTAEAQILEKRNLYL